MFKWVSENKNYADVAVTLALVFVVDTDCSDFKTAENVCVFDSRRSLRKYLDFTS